ncbi:MAG: MFS transporter [Gemmatimonadota bacterium]|nr:MFS transporter [Gemmatimonadota bacterium]
MRESRVRLGLFFAGNVLFGAGLFFHAFLYNFYLEALGQNEVVMGLAAASLTAGGLIALIPAGRSVDRVGTQITLLSASVLAAVGLALGAWAERAFAIYAAAFVAGLGTVTWRVAMGPVVMELAPARFRSQAFSWNVALLVGSGAVWMTTAGALAGWLERNVGVTQLGAQRLALLAGVIGTAAAAPLFALAGRRVRMRGASPEDGSVVGNARGPDRALVRQYAGPIAAVALWMLAPALALPFFNLFFSRVHELPVDRIGLVFGASHVATALVIFTSGIFAARLGARRVLTVWTCTFGPLLWALGFAHLLPLALGLYFLQGIVSPAANPLIDEILLERAPPERRGLVSSWRNAATEVAGIVGAGVGGLVLRQSSFDALFVLAGTLGAVAAAALWIVLKRSSRS